jgi:hypothetical protein
MRPSPNGDIISVISRETQTDYVFLGSVVGVVLKNAFYVLKVASDQNPIIEPPPDGYGNMNIIVGFMLNSAEKTFILSSSSATFSQADLETAADKKVSVTLTNYAANPFDTGSVKWRYNTGYPDAKEWIGATLEIDFANAANRDLLVIGQYIITIEAAVGGVPYRAVPDFVLNITP